MLTNKIFFVIPTPESFDCSNAKTKRHQKLFRTAYASFDQVGQVFTDQPRTLSLLILALTQNGESKSVVMNFHLKKQKFCFAEAAPNNVERMRSYQTCAVSMEIRFKETSGQILCFFKSL